MSGQSSKIVKKDLGVGVGGTPTLAKDIKRRGQASAAGGYASAGTFGDDSDSEEIGAYAGAGLGDARAQWRCFDAQAKGPNAAAGYELSSAAGTRAFAKAELASASASAGPVKATVGLNADTGVGIGPWSLEAKVLGTGVSFGRKMGISFLGSGFEVKLW